MPVLEASQLRVGTYLTGIFPSSVWEVLEVQRIHLMVQKVPHYSCTMERHAFTPTKGGGQACLCGMRQQAIKDFLPIHTWAKARVHMITPLGTVRTPEANAVYAALTPGECMMYTTNGMVWSGPLPIIPELHEVWRLPEALVRWMKEAPRDEVGATRGDVGGVTEIPF